MKIFHILALAGAHALRVTSRRTISTAVCATFVNPAASHAFLDKPPVVTGPLTGGVKGLDNKMQDALDLWSRKGWYETEDKP